MSMLEGTRLATQTDVPEIVKFLEKYHTEDSNLSDIPFDKRSMIKCVEYYIGMPKHVAFVYAKEGEIKGVLMASIEPFMFNEKRKWATDLLNVAEQGGAWLVKRFLAWANMHKVDRVVMGVSTGKERTDQLYKAMGLEQTGGMWMLNTKEAED